MRPILQAVNINKSFKLKKELFDFTSPVVNVLNNVSVDLLKGEILGLVGESGSGKTTLGKTLVRLHNVDSGKIVFDGKDISRLSENELFRYRKKIQFIFQDPLAALNPRFTVGDIIREPLESFNICSKHDRQKRIIELMNKVRLAGNTLRKYPHELSNGQRQRIGIARAIATHPEVLIADEPVSSLDLTIQVRILSLLKEIQKELGLSILFISHDLSIIEHFTDRVAVMYSGEIVESAPSVELYSRPLHPYTRALLSASHCLYTAHKKETLYLRDEPSSEKAHDGACCFSSRCFMRARDCGSRQNKLKEVSKDHYVRCLLV